jgi:hypothetical protein
MMDPAKALADDGVVAKSLTHALPYWAVVNGAMLLSDGSYELGFELETVHLDTMSEGELMDFTRRLKRFVEVLPPLERARFVYAKDFGVEEEIRKSEQLAASDDGPSAYLHRRRTQWVRTLHSRGALIGRKLLLCLTYHPPRTRPPKHWATALVLGGLVALFAGLWIGWKAGLLLGAITGGFYYWVFGARPRKPFTPLTRKELERDREELNGLRTIIIGALRNAGIRARPLEDDEYVAWAWRYFNPGRAASGLKPPTANHTTRVELPKRLLREKKGWLGGGEWMPDTSLRQVIARSGIVRDPDTLYVDGMLVRVLAMDTLPVGETLMNQLVRLLASSTKFTVVVDVVREPRAAALARLALRSRLLQSIAQSEAPDVVGAERGLEVTRQVQYMAVGGELEIVRFGVAVVIASRTREELEAAQREVLEFFATDLQDVHMVREDAALGRQFLALAPFSGKVNHRTRAAQSITAVHFLPVAGPPEGSEKPVLLLSSRYRNVMGLDPFDPRQSSWNAVAAGKTGSGKTFFSAVLALAAHAAGIQVIVVDRGHNVPPGPWLSATRYVGGQYISMDPASGVSINPCDLPPGEVEPDPHKVTFLVTLIDRMVAETGSRLDGYERGLVESAVRAAYARNLREADTPDGPARVLEPVYLRDIVQSLRMLGVVAGAHQATEEDRRAAQRIATRLYQWVERGRFAGLVDRPTTVSIDSDWIYIDVAALQDNPELMPVMILVLTDMIWRHVNRNIGRRRTLVVLDEVWALVADPVAGPFVEDLYRRFRTTGSGVLAISQDIRDFMDNKHALAVLSNCSTYYLFHTENPGAYGQVLGLNEREVNLNLANLTASTGGFSELMVVRRFPDRTRSGVVVLYPSRWDYWLVGSHAHERALRERYFREYGNMRDALEALVRENPQGVAPALSEGAREVSRR